jgi:hypothetical protein
VLLPLTYLAVTNAFAVLGLRRMSDRDKDAEILSLRHQLAVLQRQLGPCIGRVLDHYRHSLREDVGLRHIRLLRCCEHVSQRGETVIAAVNAERLSRTRRRLGAAR